MTQAATRTGRSRRAMLATVATSAVVLPAVAAASHPAVALPASARAAGAFPATAPAVSDPHAGWAREVEALVARLDTPGLVADEDTPALVDRQYGLECLLADTPARTLDGALEQIALVRRRAAEGCTPDGRDEAALGNALATIGRLRTGGGQAPSLAASPRPAEADPHLAWAVERERLRRTARSAVVGEEEAERMMERMFAVEDRLWRTPARTLGGALVQLTTSAAVVTHGAGHYPAYAGLRNAVATLDRLLGGKDRT